MIYSAARKIVLYMQEKNIVDDNDKEIYEYGAQIFLATVISISGACLIAIVLDKFLLGVLFICVYCSLRSNTGGYHADSFRSCIGIFLIIFTVFIKGADIFSEYINNMEFVAFFVISNLILILLGGVSNLENPIDVFRKKVMKKRAILILNSWFIVLMLVLEINRIVSTVIALAIFLNELFLIVGKIKNERIKKYEEI